VYEVIVVEAPLRRHVPPLTFCCWTYWTELPPDQKEGLRRDLSSQPLSAIAAGAGSGGAERPVAGRVPRRGGRHTPGGRSQWGRRWSRNGVHSVPALPGWRPT